ncbi:MAG: phenylacetate-CoA oxygenase subunit PaaC [Candidatus Kapabacteria bacterium]|nr:phenylacetate-CoA oxygenase subunit PaaC [Candidatus Kapabacteria bacterium]MDW8012068.1 1,2-phenylacetyl-CoA epoxidase subunit PaaC [Bacteroidota bacterium]
MTVLPVELRPALKDLLYRMADDALILGHRHSEWTGLGPILEEDIAFSSIAQDKIGHAYALYQLLHELGEPDPDRIAFFRDAPEFRCCHLVEYPNGGYDFSLMRHLLFDVAEQWRYHLLEGSRYEPLARLARKVRGEIKYHVLHATQWVVQLGARGTEESHHRMQQALERVFPLALGIFEVTPYDELLAAEGIFLGERVLQERWLETISSIIEQATLQLPDLQTVVPAYGGRRGIHTEYLQPLLDEMGEVIRSEPDAEW